ncbi:MULTISPECIES: hypothetical protein [Enterococcus]|uniref:Uncharacterized protein n=1 Tax=Candidatus Enterococcus murrayae TaxID=2815321 RepID=A0ABS3HEP1_9ENTE|nr:hypothetical protein [Enterococcus sp. MJM16]MBO0451472.1 hypothetical protein [Enterococcus sp. MJM16]
MSHSYNEIKQVALQLIKAEKIRGLFYFAGGIVPYLLADSESDREHGDIDVVVEKSDMPMIREYLKEQKVYQKATDSMFIPFNRKQLDFGLVVQINEIPVNFSPFTLYGGEMRQRNFSLEEAGQALLVEALLRDVESEVFFSTNVLEKKQIIKSYSLETVKAAKKQSNRWKDQIDIRQIDSMGVNSQKYARLAKAFNMMSLEMISADTYDELLAAGDDIKE